ncbi:MAG: hypothetical protein NC203_04730 [Firmicutes bacterium]|nr:hypothetical protein [[Eubacterium] siraeum]MCM1487654.1 hypothetical protein [Bacillota bacterium]
MSKKQIKISKLMDSYTDDEFFIEGAESAGLSEVRSKVMEQVQNKKHLKLSKKILIIAAAVVGVTAITAAALPYGIFTSQTNGRYSFGQGMDTIAEPTGEEIPPYTVNGDKVYFTANGENIDITDKIGEDKFYFYQFSDTDSLGDEVICVYAVCRSSSSEDNLAYGEHIYKKDKEGGFSTYSAGYMWGGSDAYCYYKDGEVIMVNDPDDPSYEEKITEYSSYPHRNINAAWLNTLHERETEWYNIVFSGKALDVSESDTSITGEDTLTEWLYPEGWTGEYVPEGV